MTSFRDNLWRTFRELAPDRAEVRFASEYGEPGYSSERGVVIANWNHASDRIFDVLERAGYGCEWCDEWDICDRNKAWRSQPNAYHWQPSTMYTEGGDLITLDDDPSVWIEECQTGSPNTVMQVLPYWITDEDLTAAGFTLRDDHMETGFHAGQTDDPKKCAQLAFRAGADAVVFRKTQNSQFYIVWQCWARMPEEREV